MTPKEPDSSESIPPLPRPLDDANEIRRLREEARRNLDAEERYPAAVDGGLPMGAGPPRGAEPPSRRGILKRILIVIFGLIAAGLAALFYGTRPGPGPGNVIYGGPPPQPAPDHGNPVYGGPVPPPPGPEDERKKRKPSPRKRVAPNAPLDHGQPRPPAAVYGGPAPRPQPPTPPDTPQ